MNPTHNIHTHYQAAQSSRTGQSLSISVSAPTHGQKKKKYDRTTLHISNGGQSAISEVNMCKLNNGAIMKVGAIKSATAHILVR
jgi:hypothetical protein